MESLIVNSGLRLVDFKACTREFYFQMQQGVNSYKIGEKVVMIRDKDFIGSTSKARNKTPEAKKERSILNLQI